MIPKFVSGGFVPHKKLRTQDAIWMSEITSALVLCRIRSLAFAEHIFVDPKLVPEAFANTIKQLELPYRNV